MATLDSTTTSTLASNLMQSFTEKILRKICSRRISLTLSAWMILMVFSRLRLARTKKQLNSLSCKRRREENVSYALMLAMRLLESSSTKESSMPRLNKRAPQNLKFGAARESRNLRGEVVVPLVKVEKTQAGKVVANG